MKRYTLNEAKDMILGESGTELRDKYEQHLDQELHQLLTYFNRSKHSKCIVKNLTIAMSEREKMLLEMCEEILLLSKTMMQKLICAKPEYVHELIPIKHKLKDITQQGMNMKIEAEEHHRQIKLIFDE